MTEREQQLLKRQQVLGDFGELAIRSQDLTEVLTEACRLVAEALGTHRAKVLEIQEGTRELLVRAGVGWNPDVVGHVRLPMDEHSSETFAIKAGEPVICQDILEEDRFTFPDFMTREGVRALANVPIFLPGRKPYGLLQVDDTKPRTFTDEDTQFLRTYATILGPVIDRLQKVAQLSEVETRERQHEARFRTIFETASVGLSVVNAEGRFLGVNKEMARILGRSENELVSHGVADVTHPDDIAPSIAATKQCLENGILVSLDKRYVRPNGNLVTASSSLTPLPLGDGSTGILAVTVDLTRRHRAEQALRDSEERHRLILESARDYAIFTTDVAGRITGWPAGAEAVFGWSAEEITGKLVDMTFTPEDRENGVPEQERATARDEGYAPNVRWHVRKGGERIFIEGSTRPLRESERGGALGFIKIGQDVTARRDAEQRQQVLFAELQHRTRNLIGVVRSIADRTAGGASTMEAFLPSFRGRLDALARINSLLSKLDHGERVVFDEMIQTELAARGFPGNDEGERVVLDGPESVRLRSATVQTFALAIHELATNAVKYGALSDENGRLRVSWRVGRDEAGLDRLHVEWIESCVSGMPKEGDPPRGGGYGRMLIEQALPYQLDAKTTYELSPDGVRCTIDLPLR